jgi:hypothetical protein
MSRRHLLLQSQESVTSTAIDPASFVSVIDNPYFSLPVGTTFVYQSPDGAAVNTIEVTTKTKEIMGVTCTVVLDTVYVDGRVTEKTFDYFAQDSTGTVWYFGEQTKEFDEAGGHVSREGSWLAGVNGGLPGIIMEAHPQVGDNYLEEFGPDVAEDSALITSVTASTSVAYGSFSNLLLTDETTPLEPGFVEHKFYGSGIGLLQEVANNGEQMDLVKILFNGTSHDDTLVGRAGNDELVGLDGNDDLRGLAGDDIINGGLGHDTLEGGAGSDTYVYRAANEGTDTIIGFQTGAGGDVLDLHDVLQGFEVGDDANDFVNLVESGGNTTVQVDINGATGGSHFTDVCVLSGATGATVDNLVADGNLALT